MNNDKADDQLRDAWIQHAILFLKQGKSQISIITYLRSQGVGDELAKELSYDIFAAARKQIIRKQRPLRAIAWSLILFGVIAPISLFLLAGTIAPLSAAPTLLGISLLYRLPNPKGLPRSFTNERTR